ncbi:MAG: S1/P1 nuclease [Gemmatimonadales bacterium]
MPDTPIMRHPLRSLRSAALAFLLPLALRPLDRDTRWWDLGHRIVARLAEQRLTPHARDAVRDILGGQSLADASVWADNIRQYRHDADALHYVNIPLADTAYDPARDCPDGRCVIAAIAADRAVLANPVAAGTDRAEALRFLVHFMGDLHQPLHVADDGDRGGNRRTVYLLGDSTNLHAVWDGALLERQGATEQSRLTLLRRQMDTMDLAALERGTVADWAMEGHRTAVSVAYGLIPRDGRLDQAYVDAAGTAIDHALIAAGVRLARVLNETLANYRPPPPGQRAAAVGPGEYADREAVAHVGETASVVGPVASVFRSKGGNVYLNFGADYPRQTFTAVALAPAPGWTRGLDSLAGTRVAVHGRIVSYRGRVEIELQDSSQIQAASGPPR